MAEACEKFATLCLTEPGAGSDAAAIASTARRDGDRYILNGEKMWISLADYADHYLTLAMTDPVAGHRGISAFIVERAFDGVTTGAIHGKLGICAGNTGFVAFQDVFVAYEYQQLAAIGPDPMGPKRPRSGTADHLAFVVKYRSVAGADKLATARLPYDLASHVR